MIVNKFIMINVISKKISKNKNILNLIVSISWAILLTFSSIDWKAAEIQRWDWINKATETSYKVVNIHDALDSKAIAPDQNIKFLKDRVESFSFFDLKTVSRDEFEGLHWDFLQKSWKWSLEWWDTISHTLYLPDIIYIWDLPDIIKKINNLTFGDSLPDNASYIEIQRNIESAMIYILSLKTDKNKKEIQKTINKYYKLYQEFFPWETPNIDTTNNSTNIDKWTYYFKNSSLKETKDIKNKYPNIESDFLIKKVDMAVADNIYQHFYESFFEHWSEMLSNIWTLKEDMWLEKMKSELEKIKKTWNKLDISKKEKIILNNIMKYVHNFWFITDYIHKSIFETSIPSEIIKTKEITCVWFSILANNILSDLWIKYNILYSPWHSLVNVELSNWDKYLFDLLEHDKIVKYKEIGKIWWWQEISYNIGWENKQTKIIEWVNSEKILIAHILENKQTIIPTDTKKDLIRWLSILNMAKKLSPQIPAIHYSIVRSQYKLENYEDALISINDALKLSPKSLKFRRKKISICLKLDDMDGYDYANDMYDKLSKEKQK